jgi:ABC-type transport system involved in multi-copper enzyme maturation permease subunit
MKDSPIRATLGYLVRDTFRQARAHGIFAVLLVVSLLSIAVCASISVSGPVTLAADGDNPDFLPRHDPEAADAGKLAQSGVTVAGGSLTLAFGAIKVPLARDTRSAIHFIELLLAGGVADTLGLMLTLIWTAGFLPGFLEGRSISVLLAKPAPRWVLILGKYAGVLMFVLFNAIVFVGGTWTAIGLRTGFWDPTYLLSIPLLLLHFSIFFGFSVLLAVCTRNAVVCVFGSLVFWCVAWSMNFGRHAFITSTDMVSDSLRSPLLSTLIDCGYWVLPKPADLGMLLYDSLGAQDHFGKLLDPAALATHGFSMTLSVASSLAFTAVVLFASVRTFKLTDY